jgi:hypothetical protein
MRNGLLLVLLPILVIGCASVPSDPIRHQDFKDLENPFSTDTTTIYLEMNGGAPGVSAAGPYAWTYIELTKWTDTAHSWFTVNVRYEGSDWHFMTGDVRVRTTAGIAHLSDPKPTRNVVRGGVTETIRARTDGSLIRSMAESSEVQMQFFGEPVTITPDGLKAIRVFYQRIVLGEPQN